VTALLLGCVIAGVAAMSLVLAMYRGYAIRKAGKIYRDRNPALYRKAQNISWYILGVGIVMVATGLISLFKSSN